MVKLLFGIGNGNNSVIVHLPVSIFSRFYNFLLVGITKSLYIFYKADKPVSRAYFILYGEEFGVAVGVDEPGDNSPLHAQCGS
jgi:hypothetical protein